MRRTYLATSALWLGACGDAPEGPRFSIRYHPPAGAQYRYEIRQDLKMGFSGGLLSLAGDQAFTLRLYFTQEVAEPHNGRVDVSTTVDSAIVESTTVPRVLMDSSLKRMRGLRAVRGFDNRMRVVAVSDSGEPGTRPVIPGEVSDGLQGVTFTLPETPVRKRDSWTVPTELGLGDLPVGTQAVKAQTTYTVRDVRVVGTDTVMRVSFDTALPEGPIPLELEGRRASVRLTGSLSGEFEFSVLSGAMLNGARNGSLRMTLAGGPLGDASATLTMRQRSQIRLLN